jgi:hypothetical protein
MLFAEVDDFACENPRTLADNIATNESSMGPLADFAHFENAPDWSATVREILILTRSALCKADLIEERTAFPSRPQPLG